MKLALRLNYNYVSLCLRYMDGGNNYGTAGRASITSRPMNEMKNLRYYHVIAYYCLL